MKKALFVLSLIVFLIPLETFAQSMSNKERRYVNTLVLNVIEEYERYSTLYDEEASYYFLDLFETPDSPIVCDIIGLPSYLSQVSVTDYINMMRNYTSTATVMIYDVSKGELKHSEKGWIIPVTFKKNVSYLDNIGCAFSIGDYYGDVMDMSMNLIYYPEHGVCKVESITGNIVSKYKFPEGRFMIVLNKFSSDNAELAGQMKINGKHFEYDQFDQAILPGGQDLPTVNDIDISVYPDTLTRGYNYDIVSYTFKKRNARTKLRYSLAPFSAYNVSSSFDVADKSGAMEFGVDIGITWAAGKKAKMGLFVGAGISSSKLSLSLTQPLNYIYTTSVMGSNGLFSNQKHNFNIKSASETLKFIDFVIPLYFETEHRIGNYVMISWNFGVKTYYNSFINTSYQLNGDMTITDDVMGKEVKDIVLSNNYILPASYKRNPVDVSACVNLGVDVNIYKKLLYFSLKSGYEYGLTDSYKSTGLTYYQNAQKKIYPVVYNSMTSQFVSMHTFIGGTSYRRQAVWFDFGFKYKF